MLHSDHVTTGEGRPEVTTITYKALYEEVAVYAEALKKLGIQKGDRVVGKKYL